MVVGTTMIVRMERTRTAKGTETMETMKRPAIISYLSETNNFS
jgi:hypothetical protein